MATPTTGHPPSTAPGSHKAVGNVSTPAQFSLSSPALRSGPSPTAIRKEQAGKTPINHPTGGSSQGSKTIYSTPMIQNLSQQGHITGSPTAHLMSFGTPVGLGVEGLTPSQLNLATPGMGGLAMGLTLSELGVTSGGTAKRNEEEERRAKLRKVLRAIGRKKGRISEEGIMRIARRAGLDNDIDANRISIAGKKMIIDVSLHNQTPGEVQITFDTENAGLATQAEAVGKILSADLEIGTSSSITAMLDRFAANLEALAHIDRLSDAELNCFEALSGIYSSLRRLYVHEVALANEMDAMCQKSGKPKMHEEGRVGLRLAYWKHGALDTRKLQKTKQETVYDLWLSIERSPANLFPPIRISDNWIGELSDIGDNRQATGAVIPWLDPPPTIVSSHANGDVMALSMSQKLPELHFIAKLDPPLVLPWQVASAVIQVMGQPAPQFFSYPPSWHHLLMNSTINGTTSYSDEPLQVNCDLLGSNGQEVRHAYTVDVVKSDGGFKLENLPYSHPRQLVELLPTLRQWACFGFLVRQVLSSHASPGHDMSMETTKESGTDQAFPIALHQLLATTTTADTPPRVPISISITTMPVPSLSFLVQSKKTSSTISIVVQISSNAKVAAHFQDEQQDRQKHSERDIQFSKALEACDSLPVWLEWIRCNA